MERNLNELGMIIVVLLISQPLFAFRDQVDSLLVEKVSTSEVVVFAEIHNSNMSVPNAAEKIFNSSGLGVFDCLVLETGDDYQESLDQFNNGASFESTYRKFKYEWGKSFGVEFSDENLDSEKTLFRLARTFNMKVFAMDIPLHMKNYYSIRKIEDKTQRKHIELEEFKRRNVYMAEKINNLLERSICNRLAVQTGAAHVYSKEEDPITKEEVVPIHELLGLPRKFITLVRLVPSKEKNTEDLSIYDLVIREE